MMSNMNGIGFFVVAIIFLLFFMLAVYYVTRLIAGKAGRAMKGRYIQRIETISLDKDNRLHLVKVGTQFFLLSSSGKNAEIIREINIEGFGVEKDEGFSPFKFKEYINKYIGSYKNKGRADNINKENKSSDVKMDLVGKQETFKENLTKLKGIIQKTNNESEN